MTSYREFFDMSFDAMCVVEAGMIAEVNSTMCRLLGYSKHELLSRSLLSVVHVDDVELMRDIAALAPGTDVRFLSKSAEVVWFQWSFRKSGDRYYGVAKDRTETRTIENEIGQYVIDLRNSKEEAERFAYAASHDLQEPLRTIANYAGFLSDDFGSLLPEEGREFIGYIKDGAENCRRLVSDLLQLSRVGRDQKSKWVESSDLISQALLNLEFRIAESRATVTVSGNLPLVYVDPMMFVLLVQNLVSNSIKFHNGSDPDVTIGCEEDDISWHFTVSDNGIGLDPQYAELVFAVFKRIERSRPGTGIGLAICRKVIELHRGKIWLVSNLGHGATVHFVIPKPDRTNDETPGEHPTSRGPSTGRARDAESSAALEDPAPPVRSSGRSRGVVVLASSGTLRDRPKTRSRTPRLEST